MILAHVLVLMMWAQQPTVRPASGAYMICKPHGIVDIYGWELLKGMSLDDGLPRAIVREYPEYTYGDCSKWKEQPDWIITDRPQIFVHLDGATPFDDIVACEGTHIHGEPLHCVDSQGQDVNVPSPTPEPVDVPAIRRKSTQPVFKLKAAEAMNKQCRSGWKQGNYILDSCSPQSGRCAKSWSGNQSYEDFDYWYCGDELTTAECPDRTRILIGPDGNGHYFCHKPQTGVQP